MTDREILDLFHSESGRERAFRILMEKYQQKLYWHIRRMVILHEDANDVTQTTFMKVWMALENFRADSQLYTWLYRIATNECLNFLSSQKKRAAVPFESNDDSDEDTYSPSNYIKADQYFDGDEMQQKLIFAIAQLPEKQKIVFNLRYYDEMPYEQMSEVLQTSVGALKASYHHAVQKVEKYLLGN